MIIKKSIVGATAYLNHHAAYLAKVLGVFFALYVLLDQLKGFEAFKAFVLPATVLTLWLQAVISIITHRVVLTGSVSQPDKNMPLWGPRESRFFLYMLGLLMLIFPIFFLVELSPLLGAMGGICAIWVICRCSLVFPALAAGHDITLSVAWDMTKNYQLDMLVIVLLIPIFLILPVLLVSLIPYSSLIVSILLGLCVVFQVAVLAVAYKVICEDGQTPDSNTEV